MINIDKVIAGYIKKQSIVGNYLENGTIANHYYDYNDYQVEIYSTTESTLIVYSDKFGDKIFTSKWDGKCAGNINLICEGDSLKHSKSLLNLTKAIPRMKTKLAIIYNNYGRSDIIKI